VISIRLWPGIVAVVFMRVVRVVIPHVLLEASFFGFDVQLVGVMGSILGAVAIAVWWVVFSRAAWPDRLAAIILMIGVLAMTGRVAHESIAGAGMGMLLYVQAIPVLGVALVVWAAASRNLSPGFRRASLVVRSSCLRTVHGGAHQRRDERRHRIRVPLAMDADAGSAAPGSGRRRAGGASLTLNPSGGSKRARHDRRNRECRSRRCSVRR